MKAKNYMMAVNKLKDQSSVARAAILKATTIAGSGHPGGSMSSIDMLLALYEYANIGHQNFNQEVRDRIIISNGHISPGVYSALALNGFFDMNDFISQFRLAGSIFEGHVERDTPGVEWGSGNLGQGLSAGCGFALSSKLKSIDNRVYVLMGDGEQQKGQLSEARRFAVKYGLNNLTALIDYNRLQIGGDIGEIMPQNIVANYESDGWKVIEIDGHSYKEIYAALDQAEKNDAPTLILAHTVMGKGVAFMENKEQYHGAALKEEQLSKALEELNQPNDFKHLKEMRADFFKAHQPLECVMPPHKIINELSIDIDNIRKYDDPIDNRSAWGNALTDIANGMKEHYKDTFCPVAVFDCDLQGSVKTKDFEKVLPNNFIQCGISEHHTATIAGSISIENVLTFFADFGVFGIDETYNQHRLNDINMTNLKLIVTHVGLDVGEDGKTHQCLDYVGMMRNLFHFKVIVPVCPNQTDRVIRYVAQHKGNFLVAMGRSKVPVIRKDNGELFYDENYRFEYGKPDKLRDGKDGALLMMGSVAAKAIEATEILKQQQKSLQLWAVSSPTAVNPEMLREAAATGTIFTYEDHNVNTGLGSIVAEKLVEQGLHCKLHRFGVANYCLSGKSSDVYTHAGLDATTVSKKITELLKP